MSAVFMSCAIIGLHGALRVPDDLFLDDTDVSGGWCLQCSLAVVPDEVSVLLCVHDRTGQRACVAAGWPACACQQPPVSQQAACAARY